MKLSLVVPWRGGCPHRVEALAWVLDRYHAAFSDIDVAFGSCGEGPFNRSAAILDGATKAAGDVLVVADGDCWTDGLPEALLAIEAGAPWAVPHDKLHRLTEPSTRRVLEGEEPGRAMRLEQTPYTGYEAGTLLVIRRAVLETVPPDPRFVGWGHEEQAWAYALRTLVSPPWRSTKAPLWHLWHPPQERKTRSSGSDENRALLKRYAKARLDPAAMRSLLEEAPCIQNS